MKSKIILAAILILLGYQAFSQQITIKGRLIDYETGDPILQAAVSSVISDNDGRAKYESGTVSDAEGKFEFTGKPEWIEVTYIGYFRVKIINIPKEMNEIDFGDIFLAVVKYHPSVAELISGEVDQEQLNEFNRIYIESVLEDFCLDVYGKECKPYFENQSLVYDLSKNENE